MMTTQYELVRTKSTEHQEQTQGWYLHTGKIAAKLQEAAEFAGETMKPKEIAEAVRQEKASWLDAAAVRESSEGFICHPDQTSIVLDMGQPYPIGKLDAAGTYYIFSMPFSGHRSCHVDQYHAYRYIFTAGWYTLQGGNKRSRIYYRCMSECKSPIWNSPEHKHARTMSYDGMQSVISSVLVVMHGLRLKEADELAEVIMRQIPQAAGLHDVWMQQGLDKRTQTFSNWVRPDYSDYKPTINPNGITDLKHTAAACPDLWNTTTRKPMELDRDRTGAVFQEAMQLIYGNEGATYLVQFAAVVLYHAPDKIRWQSAPMAVSRHQSNGKSIIYTRILQPLLGYRANGASWGLTISPKETNANTDAEVGSGGCRLYSYNEFNDSKKGNILLDTLKARMDAPTVQIRCLSGEYQEVLNDRYYYFQSNKPEYMSITSEESKRFYLLDCQLPGEADIQPHVRDCEPQTETARKWLRAMGLVNVLAYNLPMLAAWLQEYYRTEGDTFWYSLPSHVRTGQTQRRLWAQYTIHQRNADMDKIEPYIEGAEVLTMSLLRHAIKVTGGNEAHIKSRLLQHYVLHTITDNQGNPAAKQRIKARVSDTGTIADRTMELRGIYVRKDLDGKLSQAEIEQRLYSHTYHVYNDYVRGLGYHNTSNPAEIALLRDYKAIAGKGDAQAPTYHTRNPALEQDGIDCPF